MQRLNETAVETIADFKNKMILRLECLNDELFNDLRHAKAATKDKIVNNIIDVCKQMMVLKGIATEVSKVKQQVEVKKYIKLEDYFM